MSVLSTNMGLRIWDQDTDPYNHTQLADNFNKLDLHDHTDDKGVQIPTGGIADGAITAAKIASGAIPAFSIADNSIATAKYQDGSISLAKIAVNTIPSVRAFHSANQTLSGSPGNNLGNWSTIAFNSESWDTHNMHDNVTNNSRLTAPVAGIYLINVNVSIYYTHALYESALQIRLNGGTIIGRDARPPWYTPHVGPNFNFTIPYKLAANDYIEAQFINRNPGGYSIWVDPDTFYMKPSFGMTLIGK